MRFIIRCAWCNREMGEKVIGNDSEEVVITHSICTECKEKVEKQTKDFVINRENTDD